MYYTSSIQGFPLVLRGSDFLRVEKTEAHVLKLPQLLVHPCGIHMYPFLVPSSGLLGQAGTSPHLLTTAR